MLKNYTKRNYCVHCSLDILRNISRYNVQTLGIARNIYYDPRPYIKDNVRIYIHRKLIV